MLQWFMLGDRKRPGAGSITQSSKRMEVGVLKAGAKRRDWVKKLTFARIAEQGGLG